MHSALFKRLEQHYPLSLREKAAIEYLCSAKPRHVASRKQIVTEGDCLSYIPYLLQGWAGSFKHLEDGRRQYLSFFLPGDFWEFEGPTSKRMAHSVRTMTDAILIDISRDRFAEVTAAHTGLVEAFRWSTLVTNDISREWITSLGQRTSKERCAHVICEFFWRLRATGQTNGLTMDFPFTQEEVGNTIGVSTVHANRVLQEIRNASLIKQTGKKLQILDLRGLESLAYFNPSFLHLYPDGQPINTGHVSMREQFRRIA